MSLYILNFKIKLIQYYKDLVMTRSKMWFEKWVGKFIWLNEENELIIELNLIVFWSSKLSISILKSPAIIRVSGLIIIVSI